MYISKPKFPDGELLVGQKHSLQRPLASFPTRQTLNHLLFPPRSANDPRIMLEAFFDKVTMHAAWPSLSPTPVSKSPNQPTRTSTNSNRAGTHTADDGRGCLEFAVSRAPAQQQLNLQPCESPTTHSAVFKIESFFFTLRALGVPRGALKGRAARA